MDHGREKKGISTKIATVKRDPYHAEDNFSSEEDSYSHSESWEGSLSQCSSYSHSDSDEESFVWESEIQDSGYLFFVESHPVVDSLDAANPLSWSKKGSSAQQSSTASQSGTTSGKSSSGARGKLVRLIRRRESKRHQRNVNGGKHTSNDYEQAPSNEVQLPPSTHPLKEVELQLDPWVRPNLGRRATLSETLLGLVTSTAEDGVHVVVSDFVPDGAAKSSDILIGDCIRTFNGKQVNAQNFHSVLAAINTPTLVRVGLQSIKRTPADKLLNETELKNKVIHQSSLAQQLSGRSSISDQLQDVLAKVPVALLYLQLDGLTEGGPEDQGVRYCYPSPLRSNVVGAARGAFLTLHHLLPDVTPSGPVSSSVLIQGCLTHIVYVQEERELLLLAVPHNRCSLLEASQLCAELVSVLQLTHQSLSRCFSSGSDLSALNHFVSIFFARLLTCGLWPDAQQSLPLKDIVDFTKTSAPPQLETLLPAAHWLPLPREAQMQIDDALSELESNDLGDLCDSHDCQRLYTILGSCLYHKVNDSNFFLMCSNPNHRSMIFGMGFSTLLASAGLEHISRWRVQVLLMPNEVESQGHLLASHLARVDLVDVNAYCRQHGLLHLNRSESIRSLIVWCEVFPSSVCRGKADSSPYGTPQGRWFMMIVGQKHDFLVVLLEAGGCSLSAEGNPGPDVFYVEAAQDTLRHIQKTGVTNIASKWLEANLRPQVTTPEVIASSRASPRRVNNLLGLRLQSDTGTLASGRVSGGSTNLSSPSMKKSSDMSSLIKRRTSPDQLTIHSGSGPLHGETSEDSASLVASLPSDDTGPMPNRGRRAEREQGAAAAITRSSRSDHGASEDSDSDWEAYNGKPHGRRFHSTMDFTDVHKSLLSEVEEAVPSKLTMGVENIVFHYVHVDVSEGILLCPPVPPSAQYSPPLSEILSNFRRSATHIHMLLQNTVSFKKLKSVEASQSLMNKSLVAIKEFGVLFECAIPPRGGEKQPPPLTYWVVGRLFFMPTPREVYVCYHDAAPQNMVEVAFKIALLTVG